MVILLVMNRAREEFETWSNDNGLNAESLLTDHLNALMKDGICTVENADHITAEVLRVRITNPDWAGAFDCSLGSDGKLFYDSRPF
jgi:hypothetical protein